MTGPSAFTLVYSNFKGKKNSTDIGTRWHSSTSATDIINHVAIKRKSTFTSVFHRWMGKFLFSLMNQQGE